MLPRRYPLEALAQARGAKVDAAARSLADAVRTRESAARERLAAQARKDEHDRSARAVKGAERAALERGDRSAADLARENAWAVRGAVEGEALTAGVAKARAAETKAADAQASAQRDVAERRADAGVVDKHRQGWEGARRAAANAADEEASAEAWRPKG
jgi:hypothetical protein